jgi:transposase
MKHIGLDVHTNWTTVAYLDTETGEVDEVHKLPNDQLLAYLVALAQPSRVALETGSRSIFLARQLRAVGLETLVVDAAAVKPYLEARRTAKTDKHDARSLSELLAAGELDRFAVYIPDQYIEGLRQLTRTRLAFTETATRYSNTLVALVRGEGEDLPGKLVSKHTQRWLDEFESRLTDAKRLCCQQLRAAWREAQEHEAELDKALKQIAREDARVKLLKTLPGVGDLSAVTVVAEIGDPARFAGAKQVRSYAKLVPQVSQSGNRCYTGPLVRTGNRYLCRIMVLIAEHFKRKEVLTCTALKQSYYRCRAKHGANPARIHLARELGDIVFAMLRDGTEFDASRLVVAVPRPAR